MRHTVSFGAICALLVALLAGCTSTSAPPGAAAAGPRPVAENRRTVPVTGRLADGSGEVKGTYVLRQIVQVSGGLAARVSFTGSVTDGAQVTKDGTQELTVPISSTGSGHDHECDDQCDHGDDGGYDGGGSGGARGGSCSALRLNLLPVQVSLLGITVKIDSSLLDIVAAPGNLLAGLLCQAATLFRATVAGMIDVTGNTVHELVGVMNDILELLVLQ